MPDDTPQPKPLPIEFATWLRSEVTLIDPFLVNKNTATNSRLFCLMVFALDLAGLAVFRGSLWALCAFLAAMPVAISVLVDQMPPSRMRGLSTWASYSIAALAAIATLICIVGA